MVEKSNKQDIQNTPEGRIAQYLRLFNSFQSRLLEKPYQDYIAIDHARLSLAVHKYFQDRDEIKYKNKLRGRLHRSKVAAYTAKWLIYYSPIFCTCKPEQFSALPLESQEDILNANYYFAIHIIFHALKELYVNPEDFDQGGLFSRITDDLLFYMQNGKFNAEFASVLFDALTAHYRFLKASSAKKSEENLGDC